MAETTQAASSPAEVDPFGGQQPTFHEFSQYRETGELPARFKTVETTTDAPEKTADAPAGGEPETVLDSDPDAQEPKSPAQKRILQLLAENKRLKQEATAKQGVTVPPPAPVAQQAPQTNAAEPTVEDKNADGSHRFKTYEEYTKALARWEVRQEIEAERQREAERQKLSTLQAKLDESRSRYQDADTVIFPTAKAIQDAQIPLAVKEVIGQSDVFTDLCYVLGSDSAELNKFISQAQSNPREALAKVFEYERGIRAELSKPSGNVEKAPEKRTTTAPKPPSPVSGVSSRAFDVSDESLSPEAWARKRNADIERRKSAR